MELPLYLGIGYTIGGLLAFALEAWIGKKDEPQRPF